MTMQTFVTQLCEHCGIPADTITVDTEETPEQVTITLKVPQEDSGLFIGHRGETLSSLQRLVRIVFHEELGERKCVVNINEYREQRAEKLKEMVQSAAQQVLETGRPYTLNRYYPSYERFLIHSALGELPEADQLESVSDGEGLDRRLTIRLKEAT